MKWKIATASVVAAAIMSAPLAGAAPADKGNGKGNTVGKTVSEIAKKGGGAAGVVGALVQLKPTNKGLPKALQNVQKPKPTPTPTPTPTPAP